MATAAKAKFMHASKRKQNKKREKNNSQVFFHFVFAPSPKTAELNSYKPLFLRNMGGIFYGNFSWRNY